MKTKTAVLCLSFLAVAWVLCYVFPVFGQEAGADTTQIQSWLSNPWILYGFMILGSAISMLKQFSTAVMEGSTVTVGNYLSHIQEILITLGTNTIAFFALADGGSLNFLSAVSIGYALNSLADLNPAGSRSTALMAKE